MSSRKTKILIVGSMVVLGLLTIGGIFIMREKSLPKNPPEKTNELLPNQPNNTKEKDLANKIKTDLQARLERVKNGSDEDTSPYITTFGDEIMCTVDDLDFVKKGEKISPADIGTENYQEIVNLINQVKQAREEWINQRSQEAQEKMDANPSLFFSPSKSTFNPTELVEFENWNFSGRQNGKSYSLIIPKNHSALANITIEPYTLQFYLITGIENIPLEPSPLDGTGLYKIVKLSDQITIKHYKSYQN